MNRRIPPVKEIDHSKTNPCPACGGSGELAVVVPKPGLPPLIACQCCGGLGKVSNDQLDQIETGSDLRQVRVGFLGLGLREFAEGNGLTPSCVAAAESGKRDPVLGHAVALLGLVAEANRSQGIEACSFGSTLMRVRNDK